MRKFLVATVAALVLAGCGAPSHNDADVAFAQQMIAHHQQAVQMSEMAEGVGSPRLLQLTRRIKAAQAPEIARMKGWLAEWDEPAAPHGQMPGMHGMSGHVPGMMSNGDMRRLRHTSGAAYDRLWLRMMIAHHRGAIDMAKAEIADGENPDAVALAHAIVKAQDAEITEIQGMLK